MPEDPIIIDNTPNVVIKNSDIRMGLSIGLFASSLLAGIASLFFMYFPELAMNTDIPTRAIGFVNGTISLVSGAFGLSVIVPNIPRRLK